MIIAHVAKPSSRCASSIASSDFRCEGISAADTVTFSAEEELEPLSAPSSRISTSEALGGSFVRAATTQSGPVPNPRPAFAIVSDLQATTGLFVLDSESAIRIPASNNRFLRHYQREGARFLYAAYR